MSAVRAHSRRPHWPRYVGADAAAARRFVASLPAASPITPARPKPLLPNWCAEVLAPAPPSLGALLLARWLKAKRMKPCRFGRKLGVGDIWVIRCLNGDTIPGIPLTERIAMLTECAVLPWHWQTPCGAGWLDGTSEAR